MAKSKQNALTKLRKNVEQQNATLGKLKIPKQSKPKPNTFPNLIKMK